MGRVGDHGHDLAALGARPLLDHPGPDQLVHPERVGVVDRLGAQRPAGQRLGAGPVVRRPRTAPASGAGAAATASDRPASLVGRSRARRTGRQRDSSRSVTSSTTTSPRSAVGLGRPRPTSRGTADRSEPRRRARRSVDEVDVDLDAVAASRRPARRCGCSARCGPAADDPAEVARRRRAPRADRRRAAARPPRSATASGSSTSARTTWSSTAVAVGAGTQVAGVDVGSSIVGLARPSTSAALELGPARPEISSSFWTRSVGWAPWRSHLTALSLSIVDDRRLAAAGCTGRRSR